MFDAWCLVVCVLGWVGLGWVGLGWVGLDWVEWVGSNIWGGVQSPSTKITHRHLPVIAERHFLIAYLETSYGVD